MQTNRLGDFLLDALDRRSAFTLISESQRLSRKEIVAAARSVSTLLGDHAVGPGDRVVLCIPKKIPYVVGLLGVLHENAVPVPIDTAATSASTFRRVLEETRPALVIGPWPTAEESVPTWDEHWIDAGDTVVAGESLKVVVPVNRSLTARTPEVALIVYSSGSTGNPKGIAFSHEGQIESGRALAATKREYFSGLSGTQFVRLGRMALTSPRKMFAAARRGTWMTTLSLQGISGHTVLVQALLEGAPIVLLDEFTPTKGLDFLANERVSTLVATPTMVDLMSRSSQCKSERFPALLVVGLGAEAASPDLVRRARERFGAIVMAGYGSTELGGGFLATRVTDTSEVQESSVGFVFGGGEVKILRPDGTPTEPGEVGELHCRTKRMMSAYLDGSSPPTVDGSWYATGDLAKFGPDGAVQVVGRAGDVITCDGRKFSGREVEDALRRHEGVADVAVAPVKQPGRDRQVVTAFVVPREAGHTFTRQELVDFLRSDLPPFMLPRAVRTLEDFPRGRDGKVMKHELVRLAQEVATASAPTAAAVSAAHESLAS